jgi:hypothetical protein
MNEKNEKMKKRGKKGETDLATPTYTTTSIFIVVSVAVVVLWGVDAPCASSAHRSG